MLENRTYYYYTGIGIPANGERLQTVYCGILRTLSFSHLLLPVVALALHSTGTTGSTGTVELWYVLLAVDCGASTSGKLRRTTTSSVTLPCWWND